MDEDAFSKLLWSTDRFMSADAPVPSDERERLLSMLDLYGVQNAVKFLRSGVHGAFALRRELSALSGIAEVKRTLATYFSEQDHVLKVRSVLDALNRMTFTRVEGPEGVALRRFRDQVDELRLDPVMHPIAELEAWHSCCTGRSKLPQPMLDEVSRLFAPGTPGSRLGMDNDDRPAMRQACQEAMVRWQTFIVTEASPDRGQGGEDGATDLSAALEGARPGGSASEQIIAMSDPGSSASTSERATPSQP